MCGYSALLYPVRQNIYSLKTFQSRSTDLMNSLCNAVENGKNGKVTSPYITAKCQYILGGRSPEKDQMEFEIEGGAMLHLHADMKTNYKTYPCSADSLEDCSGLYLSCMTVSQTFLFKSIYINSLKDEFSSFSIIVLLLHFFHSLVKQEAFLG